MVKSTSQVDLKWLVMKPTAPENFDGDAATDRLDPTWKAQVDLSRLNLDPTCRPSLFLSVSMSFLLVSTVLVFRHSFCAPRYI